MKQKFYLSAVAGLIAVSLTGCMDDKYDLSDIDTTSEMKLVDLVLPVNVSEVKLDEIIKLEGDGPLQIVNVGGKDVYAVIKTGEFESQPLKINDINPEIPDIKPVRADFKLITIAGSHTFDLISVPAQELTYSADNIDDYIVSLSEIFMDKEPSKLTLALALEGGAQAGVTYSLSDIEIDLPGGLNVINLPKGYQFDSASGLLKVDQLPCKDGKGEISLTVKGMKMTNETQFTGGKLNYKSSIHFKKGKLTVNSSQTSTIPEQMSFAINTTLTALHITGFSGDVHYNLDAESLNIPPVEMTDIPDFISQGKTQLLLANPQIYLGITDNPVSEYGLGFSTGLRLTKVYGSTATPYEPTELVNSKDPDGTVYDYFVLSPTDPKTYPDLFSKDKIKHVHFPGMSNILYGFGLPDKIEIDLLNPNIPVSYVDHFRLEEYGALKGDYEFLAPLAFKNDGDEKTIIEYSDTFDDWGSEDLDKLTIKELTVTADAVSTLPLDAVLHVTPIADNAENIQISEVTLKSTSGSQPIELKVTGDIRKFKGIKLVATVTAPSENALSPDQTITLTNLKAKVTGSYVTDF